MEGQNILYGNDDDLINVRGLIEARDKVRGEITTLTNEKRRLEKDVVAEEKQLSLNIESTIKKRREQVVSNFDKELDKSQDRLKKVRNERGKEKSKKVAERIKEETADLVNENKNIKEEIKTYFKQKGVPGFMDKGFIYSLYYPRNLKDLIVLVLTFVIGIVAFPSFMAWLFGAKKFLKVFVIIVFIIVSVLIYMLGYNYARVRNREAYEDMIPKRSAIRKNKGKIERIKKKIKKDKDEDRYGLHEYDEDIKELEDTIEDIVRRKNDVLADFEKTTKADICEEITNRDMPKIEKIKKQIAEVSLHLKELEQKQKDMSINLSSNYGVYLGEENMTVDRINLLISYIINGQVSNVGEAVNLSKTVANK